MANKITTLGYTLKRFRDCGYVTIKLFNGYSDTDPRSWTILINPGTSSVFLTCYINHPFIGESFFELYDGNQYIPGRLNIKTSSFEVLLEQLTKHNILGTFAREDRSFDLLVNN